MPKQLADKRSRRRKGSTTARGYGFSHQWTRRVVDRLVQAGLAKCVRCGAPILPGTKWHLDHADDRRSYLGPSHAHCNLRAAGLKTAGKPDGRRVSVVL